MTAIPIACSSAVANDPQRRVWLLATAAAGGTAAIATAIPFVSTFAPSERAKAAGGPVEVDIADMPPGGVKTVEWRGKPVWVVRRTPEMLAALQGHDGELVDPLSAKEQQPAYAKNASRAIKPEVFVAIGICTHLGCSPSDAPRAATTRACRPIGQAASSAPATAPPSTVQAGRSRTSRHRPTWRFRRTATRAIHASSLAMTPLREGQREDIAMYFRLLHDERSGAVSYLLADLDAGEAVLVDPRGADVPVLNAMLDEHQLHLKWLLRTHEHDALLTGEAAALDALGAPRIQHHLPAEELQGEPPGEPGAEPLHAVLRFGNEHVQVLSTPGHTPGCLSYLWRDRLFCGGLLAVDACPFQPRPALPEALWDSVVNDVFKRPAETLLFTGHATRARAVSNVLEQRRWHPWFGGATRDEFLARVRTLPAGATASTARTSTPQSHHEHTDDDLGLRTHH